MDEFLDNLFSSSSWSDVNAMERTSWVGSGPAETSGNLEVYERDDKNSPTSLIPSSHIMESLATQDTSILAGGESTYGLNKGLVPGVALPQQESPEHETKPSLNGVMNGNSKAGYLGLRLNTTTPTLGAVNLSSPKLLPVASGSAKSPHALPESGSFGSNDCESSELQESLTDSHSLPSIPQFWSAPSYGDLSSLSPVMGQDKLQGFGLQGEYVDGDASILGSRYIGDNAILQLDNLPASMPIDGREELQSHNMSSFTAGPQITLPRTAGMTSQLQLSQLNGNNPIKHYTNHASFSQLQPDPFTGGCNGAAKPRVRARRGQATDPHSIAERLRREKISERMKNLQELVPNSNKTDKASMLDEIIDYVKFLQLQVKVLSMSRLGAAGAVVPLITDGQAEGSSGFLLNPSAGQGADLSESADNIAFEQEVVKLMESNVTMAMQYLQTKGLCLMPIALAAAISSGNASSGPISDERKKPGLTHGVPHNGSPGVGTQQQISSDSETLMKADGTVSNNGESITSNGCNGTAVKHEEVKSTPYSIRDLQPKA